VVWLIEFLSFGLTIKVPNLHIVFYFCFYLEISFMPFKFDFIVYLILLENGRAFAF
jgi:hypothetical protein